MCDLYFLPKTLSATLFRQLARGFLSFLQLTKPWSRVEPGVPVVNGPKTILRNFDQTTDKF